MHFRTVSCQGALNYCHHFFMAFCTAENLHVNSDQRSNTNVLRWSQKGARGNRRGASEQPERRRLERSQRGTRMERSPCHSAFWFGRVYSFREYYLQCLVNTVYQTFALNAHHQYHHRSQCAAINGRLDKCARSGALCSAVIVCWQKFDA